MRNPIIFLAFILVSGTLAQAGSGYSPVWQLSCCSALVGGQLDSSSHQVLDTLVDVGRYSLHFHIVRGQGIPILFEAGGGNDGSIWNRLLGPLADITGTTLITYDRAGFGRSGLDTTRHQIADQVNDLETGLHKLGFGSSMMLVAHSLGGFYATLYASRHAHAVKAAVLIDVNLIDFFSDDHNRRSKLADTATLARLKKDNPGAYYLTLDYDNTIASMRKVSFPNAIPVIDFVSEKATQVGDSVESRRWIDAHREFVAASPNRKGITAYDCGHYIFLNNPELVIDAIVSQYASYAEHARHNEIQERAFAYAFAGANEAKRREGKFRHSEDDLNSWAYVLLRQGEGEKAMTVFKLNVMLHPQSANVYDSEAEGYEAQGDKANAILDYKRSLALNPGNKHARERLKVLEGGEMQGP